MKSLLLATLIFSQHIIAEDKLITPYDQEIHAQVNDKVYYVRANTLNGSDVISDAQITKHLTNTTSKNNVEILAATVLNTPIIREASNESIYSRKESDCLNYRNTEICNGNENLINNVVLITVKGIQLKGTSRFLKKKRYLIVEFQTELQSGQKSTWLETMEVNDYYQRILQK